MSPFICMKWIWYEYAGDGRSQSYPRLAADYLFTVRDESEAKKLPEEQAVYFYHAVAQLNYLATGGRRDIHPCVAFLTNALFHARSSVSPRSRHDR
jgi:hypothetical protein